MNICSYVLVITHPVGMLLHEAEGRVLINQRRPNWACYNLGGCSRPVAPVLMLSPVYTVPLIRIPIRISSSVNTLTRILIRVSQPTSGCGLALAKVG